jgi:hypothetical protein
MSYIIYPHENDKLVVVKCISDVNTCIEKMIPLNTPYKVIENISIDIEYFDGFIYNNGIPVPNIPICKKIHLNKFRQARTPLLAALDVDFMRADEAEDLELKKEIASKKQALRDVTKTDLPNTLEGIKKTWPEILGKKLF